MISFDFGGHNSELLRYIEAFPTTPPPPILSSYPPSLQKEVPGLRFPIHIPALFSLTS